MNGQTNYYLGIDGGGSKCRALLCDLAGNALGQGLAGAANPMRGIQPCIDAVLAASQQALIQAKLPIEHLHQCSAVAGLAGLNMQTMRAQLQQWRHPFTQLQLTTDVHIACLGAHAGASGAVIVIGTGSCATLVNANTHQDFGGHGFLLGDKASGAWFGLCSLRLLLEMLDGMRPRSLLADLLLQHLSLTSAEEVVMQFTCAKPKAFATLAPVLFAAAERGDEQASVLIRTGADYVNSLARQLLNANPARISLIGGLSQALLPWLEPGIRERLSPPLHTPEWGAIQLAKQPQLQQGCL